MTSAAPTRLARRLARLDRWPAARRLQTFAMRRAVPFLGSAGVRLVSAAPGRATLALGDRRRARNHIGGVHACAAALLAEATSGFVLAYHLPDDRVPLLVRLEVDYVQRARGGLIAVATLDESTIDRLAAEPRGETPIAVDVTDESGVAPLRATLTWAWRPRTKRS